MISLVFSRPQPLGDSSELAGAQRRSMADAVLAMLIALVLLPLRGLMQQADRTSPRMLLEPLQPDATWTITADGATPFKRAAARLVRRVHRTWPAHNLLQSRSAPSTESPGKWSRSSINEKRDSDQREPARNASRNPRGRPAR